MPLKRHAAKPLPLLLLALCTAFFIALPAAAQAEDDGPAGFFETKQQQLDDMFGVVVVRMDSVLFFRLGGNDSKLDEEELAEGEAPAFVATAGAGSFFAFQLGGRSGVPIIIIVLVSGGLFFTFRYNYINVWLFRHAINVVRGKYDNPDDEGEISHFKALTSALAATVGLGNIAGVAVAITLGGPGAVFWMWTTAFFGMSMKFSSCTLGQIYRRIGPDGRVMGGPMIYLREGMRECCPSMLWLGHILSPLFAVLTIMAAFGGGNMFQSNQTHAVVAEILQLQDSAWFSFFMGAVLAICVAVVIIGGIKRIGEVTARIVPAMCAGYVLVCLVIVLANFGEVPRLFASIFVQAFNPEAVYGGFLGVLVTGMTRAAFSNEAGLGSAAIAHAAAKTKEPVREGLVAMLGPFIDTIIVCTMTALAILVTGVHEGAKGMGGVEVTTAAFSSFSPILPYFLGVAVFVFAFSTMISWSYYGEKAVESLLGRRAILPYRIMYVIATILGPILSLGNVIGFSDMMLLSMAFPNILGMVFLSKKVKQMKLDYVSRLRSGEMKPVR